MYTPGTCFWGILGGGRSMNIISFEEILKSKIHFDNLLSRCGVRIVGQDEIHKEYKLISDLNKIISDPVKGQEFIRFYNKDGAIDFALFDLTVISYIIPHISLCSVSVIRKKIKNILKISTPVNENFENNIARNTLFELLLYSYLKSVGISAELHEPNPDILVKIQDRNYFIQCKRIFSLNEGAIRSNVLSGLRQLNNDLNKLEDNNYGIIALSVERRFTQGNKKMIATTEKSAKLELDNNLRYIAGNYGHF